MDIVETVSMVLPIVYVLVGAALVWLIVELVMTVRRARKTVDDLQKQVEPTLANVERITASLEPVVAKADPLVERVSLTVDAANLELMRVDQILEDVSEITDSVSSAVEAVDTVANVPMDIVNNVASRVRGALKSRRASDESISLGKEKAKQAAQAESPQVAHAPEAAKATSVPAEKSSVEKKAANDEASTVGFAGADSGHESVDENEPSHYFTYGDGDRKVPAEAASDHRVH